MAQYIACCCCFCLFPCCCCVFFCERRSALSRQEPVLKRHLPFFDSWHQYYFLTSILKKLIVSFLLLEKVLFLSRREPNCSLHVFFSYKKEIQNKKQREIKIFVLIFLP